MLDRQELLNELEASVGDFKVTALLGSPRSGKSSLARSLEWQEENVFDLENPMDQARLEDPREVLGELRGLVMIDGFQRQPDLFPILLELAKSWGGPSRFLVVGHPSPALLKAIEEGSGSGVNVMELSGLNIQETGSENRDRLWLRGGLPESFAASTDEESTLYRDAYVQTFLRRDLPGLGIDLPAERLRRFWVMAARHQGQPWNSSAIAAELGVSHPTARSYLNLLSECSMLRQLPALVTKGGKRIVKAPKVYVRDSGLLHGLLEIAGMEALESSPMHGASWEGFALEQLVSVLGLEADEMFFWGTHGGAEIDLIVERDGKRFGFEFKVTEKPAVTHSMTIAKADLELDAVFLVHSGERSFPLRDGMEALGYAGLGRFELP